MVQQGNIEIDFNYKILQCNFNFPPLSKNENRNYRQRSPCCSNETDFISIVVNEIVQRGCRKTTLCINRQQHFHLLLVYCHKKSIQIKGVKPTSDWKPNVNPTQLSEPIVFMEWNQIVIATMKTKTEQLYIKIKKIGYSAYVNKIANKIIVYA